MIKVIAFDYAGVVSPGPMSEWLKTHLDVNGKYFRYYKQGAHKWDIGGMRTEQIYKILSSITRIPQELIWDQFYGKSGLHEDVIKLIKVLKKDYKIILFSNFYAPILRKILNKYKATDLFDEIIISSEHRIKKPSREFFELLVQKSKAMKEEILFIDDTRQHVEAANNFGVKAILYKNPEDLINELRRLKIAL